MAPFSVPSSVASALLRETRIWPVKTLNLSLGTTVRILGDGIFLSAIGWRPGQSTRSTRHLLDSFPVHIRLDMRPIFRAHQDQTRRLGRLHYASGLGSTGKASLDGNLTNITLGPSDDLQRPGNCFHATRRRAAHIPPEARGSRICLQTHLHQLAVYLSSCRDWQV